MLLTIIKYTPYRSGIYNYLPPYTFLITQIYNCLSILLLTIIKYMPYYSDIYNCLSILSPRHMLLTITKYMPYHSGIYNYLIISINNYSNKQHAIKNY